MSVQKWEYCTVSEFGINYATAEGKKEVNHQKGKNKPFWSAVFTLGEDGWELAGIEGTWSWVFKRPKS